MRPLMCLAPLLLVGYLLTVQTPWHHTSSFDAPLIEVQSCETGLGVDAKASTSGLYGLGLQYGWTWAHDRVSFTVQPKVGISYVDHPERALPLRTQFEVGGQLLFGYNRFRVGIEYWHLSNAHLRQPNIGIDALILQTGWIF